MTQGDGQTASHARPGYFALLLRIACRVSRGPRLWFRAGPPVPLPLLPKLRQRANARYQEHRNLRNWVYAHRYRELSSDSGAIFLHIPKTAGRTVAEDLAKNAGFVWLNPVKEPTSNRLLVPHFQLDWLVRHRVLAKAFVESVPIMTVVRHPITRALSAFHYLKKIGLLPRLWDFRQFMCYLRQENPRVGGAQVSRLAHAAPQYRWLEHRTLDPSITVFRQETLESVALWTKEHLGYESKIRTLSTVADREIHLLKQNDKDLIADFYERDFSLLRYSREVSGGEQDHAILDSPQFLVHS